MDCGTALEVTMDPIRINQCDDLLDTRFRYKIHQIHIDLSWVWGLLAQFFFQ